MVEIIAEIAQGYEGNPTLANFLAKASVKADADAVKYQLVYADELATPDYKFYDLFKSLEMSEDIWEGIATFVKGCGKKLYFDIYGNRGLELAKKLHADGIKLSTTEFYNDYLVRQVLLCFKKIFIGIGGVPLKDIEAFIEKHAIDSGIDLCFLYGVQNSPTELEDNNILRIKYLKDRFPNMNFGFMDHTNGALEEALILPLLTLPLGITTIEKHITLDRVLEIEDYISALPPTRFQKFVKLVRNFEAVLGRSDMDLTDKEKNYKQRAAKVVVASQDLAAKTKLGYEHIVLKRVGVYINEDEQHNGLSEVVNKLIITDVKMNQPILKSDLA
jgi:N,N'-diacetyllegionaminate synthase